MSRGWKLDRNLRDRLLREHPPRYSNPVADHVTWPRAVASEGDGEALPPTPSSARIVGRADDGEGVEAMVVALDGSTSRPDGGTWHVTWSLGEARKAKESNDVIAAQGWTPLDGPALVLTPARW